MIESEGLTTAEVSRRLGVNANLLRKWRPKYGKQPGKQSSDVDLEAENRLLRERKELRFQFIEDHRDEWPISVMCRVVC